MYMVQKRWADVAALFNQLMLLPDWVLEDAETLSRFTNDIQLAAKEALHFPEPGETREVPSLKFAALLEQLALLAPRYEFQLPPYFLNNARALGCLEGMARTVDPDFNILEKVYPFDLDRLLSNPSNSPVLSSTLQRLCEDDLGHLCLAKADELVASAARLSGKRKHDVVMDSLRTKGGRRFFRKLLRNEIRVRWSRSRSLAAAPRAEPSSGTRGEKTVALPAGPVVSESYDLWLAGLRHAASIRTDHPLDPLGEEFISLVATALDSSFRRVEGEVPSLLLRPEVLLKQVPKVPVREEGLGLPKDERRKRDSQHSYSKHPVQRSRERIRKKPL
eukprot:g21788.t1